MSWDPETAASPAYFRASDQTEDFLATDNRGLFTELNGPNDGHVLQALSKGVLQQILAFCQYFCHGCFEQSFQAAFFDGDHDGKLQKKSAPVNSGTTLAAMLE